MKKLCLCLLLALLLSAGTAAAQTARDLVNDCAVETNCSKSKTFRFSDGKLSMRFDDEVKKRKGEKWITFTAPAGDAICALYAVFPGETAPVAVQVPDESGGWAEIARLNRGELLHEYTQLPGEYPCIRLCSTEEKGGLPITELAVLGCGELPEHIQRWEPPVEKAELMLLLAHPDDEYIFFGGLIPTYAAERGLQVAVVYMTTKNENRLHELLNGLWTAGYHQYPRLLYFYDKLATNTRIIYKYWDKEKALDTVAALLDEVQPEVVVTHDPLGEYGHGAHMACAELCTQIIRDGARPLTRTPKKLYLHLAKEAPIHMDWNVPLSRFGGRTALEVARDAFRCHKSQVGYDVLMRDGKTKFRFEVKNGGPLDNAAFGLVYTAVGPDEAKNDFLEHIGTADPETAGL